MKRNFSCLVTFILILMSISQLHAESRIRCASTTSTQNSGLFDYILPIFKQQTGIQVDVIAVGTGAALEIGRRGDADVVFVHAKELEMEALREGYFVNRKDVMYNDFVIIGPEQDPAKIKKSKTAVDAFRKIAETSSYFVSRGDKSGTHTKERTLWKQAGLDPTGQKWYLEVGQGMSKTQRIANEKRAYTLTDRGTWLATKDADNLEMVIVHEGDSILFNQYGVMAVNPDKHQHAKIIEALIFIEWLTSKEGQGTIASYKDKNGNQLFVPNAE